MWWEKRIKHLPLLLLFLLFPFLVEAQTTLDGNDSAWVLYEKGVIAIEKGDYGQAVSLLQSALLKKEKEMQSTADGEFIGFPEVDMALGDIYLQLEPELAELHYKNAYELKELLYIPEEKYAILYRLVDLYQYYPWLQKGEGSAEGYLELIIKEDEDYYNQNFLSFKEKYLETFIENGFDKLLELYRLDNLLVAPAHSELALLLFKKDSIENSQTAMEHYLFYMVTILTEIIDNVSQLDIDYEYVSREVKEDYKDLNEWEQHKNIRDWDDIQYLFMKVKDYPELNKYLIEAGFYKHLYNLGLSTLYLKEYVEIILNSLIDKLRELNPYLTFFQGKDILSRAELYREPVSLIDKLLAEEPGFFEFYSALELEQKKMENPELSSLAEIMKNLDPAIDVSKGNEILSRGELYREVISYLDVLKMYVDLDNLDELDTLGLRLYEWTPEAFIDEMDRILTERAKEVWSLIYTAQPEVPYEDLILNQLYFPELLQPID